VSAKAPAKRKSLQAQLRERSPDEILSEWRAWMRANAGSCRQAQHGANGKNALRLAKAGETE
jgi:hypothetical protein